MVYNIFGRSGSGKTERIISELRSRSGEDCVIIVPEQQALETERLLSARLGDGYNMFCEVLNFERLCDRVFREYGGAARSYLDGGGRGILMSFSLDKLSGSLKQYSRVKGGADYVGKMLSVVTSFKRARVLPDDLVELAENPAIVKSDPALSDKLSDVAEVMRAYSEYCGELNDPTDRFEHLIEVLNQYPFFENKNVFIDGYYTYTNQEYEILGLLFKQCKNAFITFCCPYGSKERHFSGIVDSYNKILRMEKQSGQSIQDIKLEINLRTKSPELAYLAENVWNPTAKPFEALDEQTVESDVIFEPDKAINVYECEGIFGEVEAAASEICTLVREKGWRYRDIGIAMRHADGYADVIEAVFEKYGIPVFVSVREDVISKPLVSLVFAAVEAAVTNFSPQSVKKYVKSSFSGLTREESDYLSSYIEMWKIRGKSRYKGVDWQMNPDGFRDRMSTYAKKILAIVSRAKQKLTETLVEFVEEISVSGGLSATECAKAIYELLTEIEAKQKLTELMRQAREDNDAERVLELSQLWDVVIAILDQLCLVGGDEKLTPQRLLEVLKIVAVQYSIGKLPTVSDAVTAAEARLARFGDIKALIVLGVNEGVFPAVQRNGELFSNTELKLLEKAGFESVLPLEKKLAEEQFLFYRTVSAPSERLSIYYSSASGSGNALKASVAVNSVLSLFPYKVKRPAIDKSCLVQTKSTAADYLLRLPESVKAMLEKQDKQEHITELSATIDPRFISDIVLSPSSIQNYNLCPFSFYLKYVLRLREQRDAVFESNVIGTFIHKLLETYFRRHVDEIADVDRSNIERELRDIAKEYIEQLSNNSADVMTARLSFLVSRLTSLVRVFVENISDEFAHSRFRPLGFELRLGDGDTLDGKIPLSDGGFLRFNGTADRIDYFDYRGERYIRVVDYKSGNQTYTPLEPANGLGLQMFLYLYAWCSDGRAKPAGVLYMPVKPPSFENSDAQKISRSGLVLLDRDIIEAMENPPQKRFIPVKYNKGVDSDGLPKIEAKSSVVSAEEMEHLFGYIIGKLSELNVKIKNGEMNIDPMYTPTKKACQYCQYIYVCRNSRDKCMREVNMTVDEAKRILFGEKADERGNN